MFDKRDLVTQQLVVCALLAFAEKSKPLTDRQFIEACEKISEAFLEMAEECRQGKRGVNSEMQPKA